MESLKEVSTDELINTRNLLKEQVNELSAANAWLVSYGGISEWKKDRLQILCSRLDEINSELNDRWVE